MSTVGDLVRTALRHGDEHGVHFVRRQHLPPDRFAELANLTHHHAWDHGVDDGSGWRIYTDGINSWWSTEAGLSNEELSWLRGLRSDVVRWLANQGLVERAHPQATPLRVQRPGRATRTTSATVASSATLTGGSAPRVWCARAPGHGSGGLRSSTRSAVSRSRPRSMSSRATSPRGNASRPDVAKSSTHPA